MTSVKPAVNPEYRPLPPKMVPIRDCPMEYQDILKSMLRVRGVTPGDIWLEDDDPIWDLVVVQMGAPIEKTAEAWRVPIAVFVTADLYTGPILNRRDVFRQVIEKREKFFQTCADEKLRFAMEQHFRHYTHPERG